MNHTTAQRLHPQVTLADDVAALAAALAASIAAHRARVGSRLAPVDVLTPHRAMSEWLRAELTALCGVVLHVRWLASPHALRAEAGASSQHILGAVHQALGSKLIEHPDLALLRAYLDRDLEDEARRALRRYELAQRVARALEQAQAHLPGGCASLGTSTEDARWVGTLWQHIEHALPDPPAEEGPKPPLFVFDVALPGYDLLELLGRRDRSVQVFLRSPRHGDADDLWSRHGQLRVIGAKRWAAAGFSTPGPAPGTDAPTARRVLRLDAPSHRRGAEAAAAQIWSWVRDPSQSPPVRFHQIGVVIPRALRDTLLPVWREVLDEAHQIPKVLWRMPLGEHNRVVALCKQLVELPSTALRRAEILGIVTHPLVAEAHEDARPDSWSDWIDAVGIFHGLDERALRGTYLEVGASGTARAVTDWDQGLLRLALGAFMGADRSGASDVLMTDHGALVPEELTQSAAPALGQMIAFLRSLLNDATTIRGARLPPREWKALLASYLVTYVRPTASEDREVRSAVLDALEVFETPGFEGSMPWEAAQAMALDALEGLHADGGGHLAQGVVVGTPADLAGVPFRRLIVFGMEQGGLPAKALQDELDRRPDDAQHRPDDPRRSDAFHFHELVEATRGEVCLVALARDPLTGEPRDTSLLAKDLEAHVRATTGQGATVVELPLHRRGQADDGAFIWAFPEAEMEARIRALGAQLTAGLRPPPAIEDLPAPWRERLGQRALPPLPAPADDVLDVTVGQLVRFLEYPTRGYGEVRLGYGADDVARDELVDEPFEHDALTLASLRHDVISEVLERAELGALNDDARTEALVEQAFTRWAAHRSAAGALPQGFFLDVARKMELEVLTEIVTGWRDEGAVAPPYARLVWGPSRRRGDTRLQRHDPVLLTPMVFGKKRLVRITGAGALISHDDKALYVFKTFLKMLPLHWSAALGRRAWIAPWVNHLLLQAGGARSARALRVEGSRACVDGRLPDTPPAEASSALETILTGLLESKTTYCCPTLALMHAWDALVPTTPEGEREALLRSLLEELYGPWGIDNEAHSPLRHVEELRFPSDAELAEVRARLAPLMEAKLDHEAAEIFGRSAEGAERDARSALAEAEEAVRLTASARATTGPGKKAKDAAAHVARARARAAEAADAARRLHEPEVHARLNDLNALIESAVRAAAEAAQAAQEHEARRAGKEAAPALDADSTKAASTKSASTKSSSTKSASTKRSSKTDPR